jgi:hypothetical protein
VRVRRVQAPLLHVRPAHVVGRQMSSGGMAVPVASGDCLLDGAASARSAFPEFQVAAGDGLRSSALARTQPLWFRRCGISSSEHHETAKHTTRQVNQWRHVRHLAMADIGYNWPI